MTIVPGNPTPDFWNGWLAAGLAEVIRDLNAGKPWRDVRDRAGSTLAEMIDHPTQADSEVFQAMVGDLPGGWVVTDQRGELYACVETEADALRAVWHTNDYLDGAATCGHSAAGLWVRERLPIVWREVTRRERAELLEEWGTPVLDREP